MTSIPIYDATVPIMCTADGEEIAGRIEQIERMRGALQSLDRTPDGLTLHFPNTTAVVEDVRQLTIDEKGCCQFWGFEISSTPQQIHLRWEGPPETTDFFAQLRAFFLSEPVTAFDGLL